MKKFSLLRYLRRWWPIIAVISLIGGVIFYTYMGGKQQYTARLSFKYMNSSAEDGLNPDGSDIDVEEVKSSTVVNSALQQLSSSKNVEDVRANINLEDYIPDDVKTIQEAAWDDGEEYEYFPVEYIMSYTTKTSADDARSMAEAIMDSYFSLYADKYLDLPSVPNGTDSLKNLNYDYLEYAELLIQFVDDIMDYLENATSLWDGFRSSETGYSFRDLYNEYSQISDIYLPGLLALILENHVTQDPELLRNKYNNRIDNDYLELTNNEDYLAEIEGIMDSFTEQNRENMDYHWSGSADTDVDESNDSSDVKGDHYVLNQVYSFDESSDNYKDTTYDQLVRQYVSTESENEGLNIDMDYCRYILSAFTGVSDTSSDEDQQTVKDEISYIETKLIDLDGILRTTAAEHSKKTAADYVAVTSSAVVTSSINLKMYLIAAILIFFVCGCLLVVIAGRGLEIIEFILYVDRVTNLTNRAGLDKKISQVSKSIPQLPFSGAAFMLKNIGEINRIHGKTGGDHVMRVFADILKNSVPNNAIVCYNGGASYVVLLPDFDNERTEYWKNTIAAEVDKFCKDAPDYNVLYDDEIMSIDPEAPVTVQGLVASLMRKLIERNK